MTEPEDCLPDAPNDLTTLDLDQALRPRTTPRRRRLTLAAMALAATLLALIVARPALPRFSRPGPPTASQPAATALPNNGLDGGTTTSSIVVVSTDTSASFTVAVINPNHLGVIVNAPHYTLLMNGKPASLVAPGVTMPYLVLSPGPNTLTIQVPNHPPYTCVVSDPPAAGDTCPVNPNQLAPQPDHTAIRVLVYTP